MATILKALKKDGTLEVFNFEKIVQAVNKSAKRVGVELSNEKICMLFDSMQPFLEGATTLTVDRIHQIVEMSLYRVDKQIANSYSGYRDWKKDMAERMETIETEVIKSMNERDRSNSNLNSTLFSAKRTNVSKILLKEMYMKYFLTEEERQAVKDGFIYPHDTDNRLIGTHNCCVVNAQDVMTDGFWINGYFCKEPKGITNAIGVMGDVLITSASAQYGGFTLREVDTTLAPYCEKTYEYWYDIFEDMCQREDDIIRKAIEQTKKELKDALQRFEFQLNTRESSRGDYAFTTISFGKDTSMWGRIIAKTILEVRREGHGDKVKQKMIFPKLIMIIREDDANEDILDEAVKTSAVALYPDYINDKVASPMGCRAFLNDFILEDGYNLNHSRFNIGVVTLNLPMILRKSQVNNLDYKEQVKYYTNMILDIQDRTYDYIGKQKAGSNPLMFTQGGFYGGNLNPEDEIGPIVKKYATASVGITALNELTVLASGLSILESKNVANDTIDLIQATIDKRMEETGLYYSIYGTPAESLMQTQVTQFRKMFGIIPGVSDRDYFSNSFHCHVTEEIDAFTKQDNEVELFHKHSGGHIQYVRIDNANNLEAIKMIVKRGVKELGLYQGTNLNACTCDDCGHTWNGKHNENCVKCGSDNVTEFNRVTGYLGFTRKKGDRTMNDAKMVEVAERKSM
ncbi:MAG: anaerobic ribonucleoside-triphosphate reductase [Paraclostridium sp.]